MQSAEQDTNSRAAREGYRRAIVNLYRQHNPQGLKSCRSLFAKYRGKEEALFIGIRERYSREKAIMDTEASQDIPADDHLHPHQHGGSFPDASQRDTDVNCSLDQFMEALRRAALCAQGVDPDGEPPTHLSQRADMFQSNASSNCWPDRPRRFTEQSPIGSGDSITEHSATRRESRNQDSELANDSDWIAGESHKKSWNKHLDYGAKDCTDSSDGWSKRDFSNKDCAAKGESRNLDSEWAQDADWIKGESHWTSWETQQDYAKDWADSSDGWSKRDSNEKDWVTKRESRNLDSEWAHDSDLIEDKSHWKSWTKHEDYGAKDWTDSNDGWSKRDSGNTDWKTYRESRNQDSEWAQHSDWIEGESHWNSCTKHHDCGANEWTDSSDWWTKRNSRDKNCETKRTFRKQDSKWAHESDWMDDDSMRDSGNTAWGSKRNEWGKWSSKRSPDRNMRVPEWHSNKKTQASRFHSGAGIVAAKREWTDKQKSRTRQVVEGHEWKSRAQPGESERNDWVPKWKAGQTASRDPNGNEQRKRKNPKKKGRTSRQRGRRKATIGRETRIDKSGLQGGGLQKDDRAVVRCWKSRWLLRALFLEPRNNTCLNTST